MQRPKSLTGDHILSVPSTLYIHIISMSTPPRMYIWRHSDGTNSTSPCTKREFCTVIDSLAPTKEAIQNTKQKLSLLTFQQFRDLWPTWDSFQDPLVRSVWIQFIPAIPRKWRDAFEQYIEELAEPSAILDDEEGYGMHHCYCYY